MTADPLASVRAALLRPAAPSSDYDLNPDVHLPPKRRLRPAGVLMAIEVSDVEARLWLTKRSSALQHHPGQVAFPGGKQDKEDVDITVTALREAEEEIGLPRASVEVLGLLAPHETVTGFLVTPVVGVIHQPFSPQPQADEVEEAFAVPLSYTLNTRRFSVQARRWRGQWRHYYTVPYGPYYIWGATARILRALADAAQQEAKTA